jgi:hypothetical protein
VPNWLTSLGMRQPEFKFDGVMESDNTVDGELRRPVAAVLVHEGIVAAKNVCFQTVVPLHCCD